MVTGAFYESGFYGGAYGALTLFGLGVLEGGGVESSRGP